MKEDIEQLESDRYQQMTERRNKRGIGSSTQSVVKKFSDTIKTIDGYKKDFEEGKALMSHELENERYQQLTERRSRDRLELNNQEKEKKQHHQHQNQHARFSAAKQAKDTFVRAQKGSKIMMPIRAAKLAFEFRKQIKHDENVEEIFFIAIVGAVIIDFIDLIPVAGSVVTFFLQPALFIFLWGTGTWKVKMIRLSLMLLDFVPVVEMAPWRTIAVLHSYVVVKKRNREAVGKIKELDSFLDI